MPRIKKLTLNEKNLIHRYLVWCYKTTKESLDRVDRYFTQGIVDHHILEDLLQNKDIKNKKEGRPYLEKINEFVKYMEEKEAKVLPQKYVDVDKEKLQPEYWYLKVRFKAVEKTIRRLLGVKELKKIQDGYENEMIRRIIEARDHP